MTETFDVIDMRCASGISPLRTTTSNKSRRWIGTNGEAPLEVLTGTSAEVLCYARRTTAFRTHQGRPEVQGPRADVQTRARSNAWEYGDTGCAVESWPQDSSRNFGQLILLSGSVEV